MTFSLSCHNFYFMRVKKETELQNFPKAENTGNCILYLEHTFTLLCVLNLILQKFANTQGVSNPTVTLLKQKLEKQLLRHQHPLSKRCKHGCKMQLHVHNKQMSCKCPCMLLHSVTGRFVCVYCSMRIKQCSHQINRSS